MTSPAANDLPRRCASCERSFASDVRFCPHCGTVLDKDVTHQSLVGQLLDGRYRVLEILGEGAMGEVYRATQVQMGRDCAVKVMRPSDISAAGGVQRFRREATAAARIAHPSVAAVYDFGEAADGRYFLAMEFVEGRSLRRLLDERAPLSIEQSVEIATQIADGLAAAHELGIVHRDIKPDNIMVRERPDGTAIAKIVDFGIAKPPAASDSVVTTTGAVVGTPLYMSPEQFVPDETIDGRSDLFALGLVLFEMLTGERPYPGSTMADALKRLAVPPRTLKQVRPNSRWPEELQLVLDRLMAFDPNDRPASSSNVALQLLDAVPEASELRRRGSRVTVTTTPRAQPALLDPRLTPRNASPTPPPVAAPAPVSRPPEKGRIRLLVGAAAVVLAAAGWIVLRPDRSPTSTPTDRSGNEAANKAPFVVADSIARIRQLILRDSLPPDTAALGRAMAEFSLPYATTREDSATLLFLGLQGSMELVDSTEVCTALRRLAPLSQGTSVHETVTMIRQRVECRSP